MNTEDNQNPTSMNKKEEITRERERESATSDIGRPNAAPKSVAFMVSTEPRLGEPGITSK